jgi:hypothetical protein
MKSFDRIAFGLACIAFLALVIAPHVAVRTHAATSAVPAAQTQYQFQTVVATVVNNPPTGLEVFQNGNYVSVESVLNSYSSQGYQLVSATEGGASNSVVYTLRAPVTGK